MSRSTRFDSLAGLPRVGLIALLALLGTLLLAGTASAQQKYLMSEGYFSRTIADGNIPFAGVTPHNCDFLVRGKRTTRMTGMGTPNPSLIPQQQQVAFGCPSGAGAIITATMAGVGGAFTLPPNIISRPPKGYLVTIPIPAAPAQVQAATDGTWLIPHATRGTGTDAIGAPASGGPGSVGPTMRLPVGCVEATCTNLADFRRFEANAWVNQSGRAGANFTWCWGNPGCTDLSQASSQNLMLIKYKSGPNAFGGTLSQLNATNIVGSLLLALGPGNYVFNRLDSGPLSAGGQVQHQGRGYADFLTEILEAGTMAFSQIMVGPVYQAALGQTVTIATMVTGPKAVPFPFNLPQVNQQYAFPLTTGTVVLRRQTAQGIPFVTITGMGGDTVTAMGARNISLVTGSLSNLSLFQSNGVTLSNLYMSLPEPGRASGLLAGAVALLGLAAWRARRVRR